MKKLFTSDRFFLVSAVLGAVGMFVYAIQMFWRGAESQNLNYLTFGLTYLTYSACIVVLYVTYRHHNKNAMKAIMGALMMTILLDSFSYLSSYSAFDHLYAIPYIIIALTLFVNHIRINSTRHPSRKLVTVNLFFLCLLVICQLIWVIYTLPGFMGSIRTVVAFIGYAIGFVFMPATILCVEARLDAYRLDREDAGWTEEKGYPEEYVREYKKK